MSGPLDNCGLRREVVYADKEVVDMLEDKDAEITRLRAELAEKDALFVEAREALERIRGCLKVPHDGTAVSYMNVSAAYADAIGMIDKLNLREKEGGK